MSNGDDGQISFRLSLDASDWETALDSAEASGKIFKQRLDAMARGASGNQKDPATLIQGINKHMQDLGAVYRVNIGRANELNKAMERAHQESAKRSALGEKDQGFSGKEYDETIAAAKDETEKLAKENQKILKQAKELLDLEYDIAKAIQGKKQKQKEYNDIIMMGVAGDAIGDEIKDNEIAGRQVKALPHESKRVGLATKAELSDFDQRLKMANAQEKAVEELNKELEKSLAIAAKQKNLDDARLRSLKEIKESAASGDNAVSDIMDSINELESSSSKSNDLFSDSEKKKNKYSFDDFDKDLAEGGGASKNAAAKQAAIKDLERLQRVLKGTATDWDKFVLGGRKAVDMLKQVGSVGGTALKGVIKGLDSASFFAWKVSSAMNMLTGSVQGLSQMAKAGEEVAKIQFSFDSMTKGAGVSLDKLREKTQGVVDDKTLMSLANFGSQAKMTGDQINLLAERALAASFVTGKGVDEMFRRMVEGIAKQEKEILDEATVRMPNAAKIWSATAKSMGKSLDDLTPDDKTKAYFDSFVKSSEHLAKVAKNLPQGLTETSKAQAAFVNQTDKLNKAFNETLAKSGALDSLGVMLEKVFSALGEANETGMVGDNLNNLANLFEVLLGLVSDLSPVIIAFIGLLGDTVTVIEGLRPLVSLLSQAVGVVFVAAAKGAAFVIGLLLKSLGELMELIPGIGEEFKDMSDAGDKLMLSASKMGEAFGQKVAPALSETKKQFTLVNGVMIEINPAFQTAITNANDFATALSGLDIQARSAAGGISAAAMSMTADIDKMAKAIDILRKGPQALAEAGATNAVIEGALAQQRQADALKLRAAQADAFYKKQAEENAKKGPWAKKDTSIYKDELGGVLPGSGPEMRAQAEYQERAAAEALDKLAKQADKFGADSGGVMTKAISEAYLEATAVSLPMVQGAGAKALDLIGGVLDPLTNKRLPKIDEYLNEADKAQLVDAMSVSAEAVERPDLFKGLDRFKQEDVKRNIKALEEYSSKMRADSERIGRELDEITRQEKEVKDKINNQAAARKAAGGAKFDRVTMSMVEPDNGTINDLVDRRLSADIQKAREAKEQERHTLEKMIKDAEDMKGELGKRIKPPPGSGGGKKQKDPKMILPELISSTMKFMQEANSVNTGELDQLSARFGANLSKQIGKVYMEGFKDDIENWRPQIEEMVDTSIVMLNQGISNSMTALNANDFETYKTATEGILMALEQGGALDYAKDPEKARAYLASVKDQLKVTEEYWQINKEFIDSSKEKANEATDKIKELNDAKAKYEAEQQEFYKQTQLTRDGADYEQNKTELRVSETDVPEWIIEKNKNPMMDKMLKEIDEKRKLIDLAAKEELAAIDNYYKQMEAVNPNMSNSLIDQLQMIAAKAQVERKRQASQGLVDIEENDVIQTPGEEATKEYADKMSAVIDTFKEDMGGKIAHNLSYSISDALFIPFNASLSLTEDWTADMLAMVEDMTGAIGSSLATMGAGMAETMGWGKIGGAMVGGVISGAWKGLMSIFRKKDARDEQEARMKERELRRKETVKDVAVSVVVNNNGLPVNAQTASQVSDLIAFDMRRGGKLNKLIYGGG